jgi:hypothetical protein
MGTNTPRQKSEWLKCPPPPPPKTCPKCQGSMGICSTPRCIQPMCCSS